ncbi:hypothetical protein ACIRD3_04270 [Kitasatospora sp. NPDC093550]|uniref:hypothetical protein n=1 Tax=Kitasatospora sp. NPDC093550 TaxID=3364089 RepID=UPI003813A36A
MNEYDGELPTRNPVFSTALDRILDLDRADLGVPELPGLWDRLRADRRPVAERGLRCPTCYDARPDQPEWMYLSLRRGRRIATHHSPHRRAHEDPRGEERRAYQERYARAAASDGHAVEIEPRAADGRCRAAVLVTGADGRRFGFEPQLSYRTAQSVRRRSRLARQDGITAVWHTVDPKAPLIDRAPWVRTDDLPARAIREDRDLLVRGGVRTLRLRRCDHTDARPCPVRGSGRCRRWHPSWEVLVPRIDDFVRRVVGGAYVPVALRADSGGALRFWAPEEDRRRYLDNGGVLVDPDAGPLIPRQRDASTGRRAVECVRVPEQRRGVDTGEPYHAALTLNAPPPAGRVIPPVRTGHCSAGRIPCGLPGARLYPAGWYCDTHRPGARH